MNTKIVKKIDQDTKINAFSKFYCRNLGLREVDGEYHVCFVTAKKNDVGKIYIASACDLNNFQPVEKKDLDSIERINDMFELVEETCPYTAWATPNNTNKILGEFKNVAAKLKLLKLSSFVSEEKISLTEDATLRRDYFDKEKTVSFQTILKTIDYVNKMEQHERNEENE